MFLALSVEISLGVVMNLVLALVVDLPGFLVRHRAPLADLFRRDHGERRLQRPHGGHRPSHRGTGLAVRDNGSPWPAPGNAQHPRWFRPAAAERIDADTPQHRLRAPGAPGADRARKDRRPPRRAIGAAHRGPNAVQYVGTCRDIGAATRPAAPRAGRLLRRWHGWAESDPAE